MPVLVDALFVVDVVGGGGEALERQHEHVHCVNHDRLLHLHTTCKLFEFEPMISICNGRYAS